MKYRKLREDIDYGDYPERMDPSIQRKLERGETPYSSHRAMPGSDPKFDQVVASKRFKDVVDKFIHHSGQRPPRGGGAMQQLMYSAMGMMREINSIERRNKQALEELAVELVKKEMGIEEGQLQFEAQLVGMGDISASPNMSGRSEEPEEQEIEDAFKEAEEHTEEIADFVDAFEKFDMEKAKRRFMNSLIQGAAKKGHYMFELVRNEIEEIEPRLMELYGVSMSILDYLYWLYPEDMVMGMSASGAGQAGQEEVDLQTDPPTVRAKGASFPILVHELLKGVYDILGASGLPDDPRQAEMVIASEDTLPAEVWDIRLGPIFWEKFLEAFPDKLFEDDHKIIRNYLFSRFSMITTDEFFTLAKSILSGNPKGKQALDRMVEDIIKELKDQDYRDTMGDEDDENDDDDLGDFLGGLGIDLPDDDED